MKTPATAAYIAAAAAAAKAAAAAAAKAAAAAAYIAAAAAAEAAAANAYVAAAAAAEELIGRARDAWLASDDPRNWQIGGESYGNAWGEVVRMIRPSDIAKLLAKQCRNGAWTNDKTMWVADWACPIDPVTDDPIEDVRVEVTTTIEADEPDCTGGDHDWHALINSVVGHGGGLVLKKVCAECGLQKTTDTWAQNPSTGEQGLTSVTYKEAE